MHTQTPVAVPTEKCRQVFKKQSARERVNSLPGVELLALLVTTDQCLLFD